MSKLEQKLQQDQRLNPRQILEANIVQLNIINLEKVIFQELEKNPALEIDDESNIEDENENIDNEEFDFNELVSNPEEIEYSKNKSSEYLDNINDIESVDLSEDIISQLNEINSSEDELNVARHILGNLDEHGFLPIEPVLIADRLGYDESFVIEVKNKIQSLDPPGIGSLSIQESILAQLKNIIKKIIFHLG